MEKTCYIDIVFASHENINPYGQFIGSEVTEERWKLDATWKNQACVRMAQVQWREDQTVEWLERHVEMTQTFIVTGYNPGLFVLGEPTHNRKDLDQKQRKIPDIKNIKAFVIPAGHGIILHKGTWHDFPISCGPPVTAFIINTEEIVTALEKCKVPQTMDEGDVFRLRLSEHWNFVLKFPDPRPFVQMHGLVKTGITTPQMGEQGYGLQMRRHEVPSGWGDGVSVYVIPVVNVEVFKPDCGGPGIQPHLKSNPEIANKAWRDYGNVQGLQRLSRMFKTLGIQATAVINSDATFIEPVKEQLLQSGWELGAHGLDNSEGNAGMTRDEEEVVFKKCLHDLSLNLGVEPKTWLTPGFSVTEQTAEVASLSGIEIFLDFGNDDVPYFLKSDKDSTNQLLCIPYCLEANDFSLVLTRHFDSNQYAQTLENHVRQLAKESGEKAVCLGMHTFVAGTPAHVYALSEMFERLKCVSGVKFATASQIYALIKRKL